MSSISHKRCTIIFTCMALLQKKGPKVLALDLMLMIIIALMAMMMMVISMLHLL